MLTDKITLVTGGTGTFGKQFIDMCWKNITLRN